MTEAIKNISENVARGVGGEGATYMANSFIEILYPPRESGRTADEIIADMKQKLKEYE